MSDYEAHFESSSKFQKDLKVEKPCRMRRISNLPKCFALSRRFQSDTGAPVQSNQQSSASQRQSANKEGKRII